MLFIFFKFRLLVFTTFIFWEMRNWTRMFLRGQWKVIIFFINFWLYLNQWNRLNYYLYLLTSITFFKNTIWLFFLNLHKIINFWLNLFFLFLIIDFYTIYFFAYCVQITKFIIFYFYLFYFFRRYCSKSIWFIFLFFTRLIVIIIWQWTIKGFIQVTNF